MKNCRPHYNPSNTISISSIMLSEVRSRKRHAISISSVLFLELRKLFIFSFDEAHPSHKMHYCSLIQFNIIGMAISFKMAIYRLCEMILKSTDLSHYLLSNITKFVWKYATKVENEQRTIFKCIFSMNCDVHYRVKHRNDRKYHTLKRKHGNRALFNYNHEPLKSFFCEIVT